MKKSILVFSFLVSFVSGSAQLPTIHAHTLIPQNPTSSSQVKIVTHLETPNSAFAVDKQYTVTPLTKSIKLHLCHAYGMPTVITHHIDTFAVGQLPQGVYSVQLNAYMSGAGQHCARVDSNFASFTFTVSGTVGVYESRSAAKVKVYPNPAHDYITIEPTGRKVRIFSLQGQLVLSAEAALSGRLSVEGLPAGMYLLEIGSPLGKEVRSIIIQ